MLLSIINKIFTPKSKLKIDKGTLPTQGWFYPDDYIIEIEKGKLTDQVKFHKSLINSNIFGIYDTIRAIIEKRIKITTNNKEIDVKTLKAIDLFYIFIEFVKFTTGDKVRFNSIEFKKENFIYFDFKKFEKYYDENSSEFVVDGWRYSPPAIGVETSLNHFSYEVAIRGKNDEYNESNYNLVYFLGDKNELSFEEIDNLLETYKDLTDIQRGEVDNVVSMFVKSGLYFLIETGKIPTRINPHQLKDIWPLKMEDI